MECGATSRDGALLLLCSNWGTDGSGSEVRAFITGDGAASAAEDVCVAGGTAVLLPLREMVVAMMLDDGN